MDCLSKATPNKKPRTKKVVKEWKEKDVFKLINLVEDERCLWDASNDSYHNKVQRDKAWQNIGEQFDMQYTTADLTAKWTNLRIQFRGYAGRTKTKSGQGAIVPLKWKFYNAMSFVGRAEDQQTQETVSNIVFEVDLESNDDADSTPPLSTPIQIKATPRRQQTESNQVAVPHIAEVMREAVTVMKERKQSEFTQNATFANFILSELNAVSDEVSASLRRKLSAFLFQYLDEERSNKIIG